MLWCTRRRRPCAGSSGPAPSHRRRRRARRGRQRGRALRSAVAASRSQRRCRRTALNGQDRARTGHGKVQVEVGVRTTTGRPTDTNKTQEARWGLEQRRDAQRET
eukprot:scaffold884_cov66-Phaeocystis_antarctica.AAC.1